MASIASRWRNASIARDSVSVVKASTYKSANGMTVDLAPDGIGPPAELTPQPHFNVMQLKMHNGPHPTLVAVIADCDALTAARRLKHQLAPALRGELDRASCPPRAAALWLAQASTDVGGAVSPAPRQLPSSMPPLAGFTGSMAVLGSVTPQCSGGWVSTGAAGFEEDLHRRTDAGRAVARPRTRLRDACPLEEGAGVWLSDALLFRGPAASVGGESDGPDYALLDSPCRLCVGAVVPPSSVTHDRALSTNEACLKPKSRRALLLCAYAQLDAAVRRGVDIVVVEPVGLGSAGCSGPAVAVARLYRDLLFRFFPGVFRLVVIAAGSEGTSDPCAAGDGAIAAGADFLAGSGDGLLSPEDVVDTAMALAAGTLDEASDAPAPGAEAASAAASSAAGQGTARSSSGFAEELLRWGLTNPSGTGSVPPVAADPASASARALSLLPALTPSQVASHPARACLHVLVGIGAPLPAPATSQLRHVLGLDATPPDSSLVRRKARARAILERAEKVSVPGGAAAATLAGVGIAVSAAWGRGRRGQDRASHGSFSSSVHSGARVASIGGYQPPMASVNGSDGGTTTHDSASMQDDDGTELVSPSTSVSARSNLVAADEGLAPDFVAGAMAFAAPDTGDLDGGDML